jgi:hypothetical protein
MSNYALVDDYIARNYNLKVFAKYLRECGLSKIGDMLEENVDSQQNLLVLENLDFISSNNFLKETSPDIVKIANYIYAEPKSLIPLYPELEFMASRDLKAFGFYLITVPCPATHAINFNDLGSFEHTVWTHNATNNIKDATFGRALIKYTPPRNYVSSLEELASGTTEIHTVFERDRNSYIDGRMNYAYCALCGLTENVIHSAQMPNREEDISKYLNSWVSEAIEARQEWTVLASLRPPVIERG